MTSWPNGSGGGTATRGDATVAVICDWCGCWSEDAFETFRKRDGDLQSGCLCRDCKNDPAVRVQYEGEPE